MNEAKLNQVFLSEISEDLGKCKTDAKVNQEKLSSYEKKRTSYEKKLENIYLRVKNERIQKVNYDQKVGNKEKIMSDDHKSFDHILNWLIDGMNEKKGKS